MERFNFAERSTLANLITRLWAATNIPVDIIKNLLTNVQSFEDAFEILQQLKNAKKMLEDKHRELLKGDNSERDNALKDLLGQDVALNLGSENPMISQVMASYLLN